MAHIKNILAVTVFWLISGMVGWGQILETENQKVEAVRLLQKKLAERDTLATSGVVATNVATGRLLTFNEIEDLYVDGKITAREFQYYVNALRRAQSSPTQGVPEVVHEKALDVLRHSEADPLKNPAPGPAVTVEQLELTAPAVSEAEKRIADDFGEIEDKVEELIRFRERREKDLAIKLGESGEGQTAEERKTKRQRLDELLRLHIYGKLSKEEYDQKRAQIIAEPE